MGGGAVRIRDRIEQSHGSFSVRLIAARRLNSGLFGFDDQPRRRFVQVSGLVFCFTHCAATGRKFLTDCRFDDDIVGKLAVFNCDDSRRRDFEVNLRGVWQTLPFVFLLDLNGDLIADL